MNQRDYSCQMLNIDLPDEWVVVQAVGAEQAARRYAARCDDNAGGDLLLNPADTQCVLVRDNGTCRRFDVRVEYSKDFYAREVQGKEKP